MASTPQASALYRQLVIASRLPKNIIPVGMTRSTRDATTNDVVEVCFSSDLVPTSLFSFDRRRAVHISPCEEEGKFIITPRNRQHEDSAILCNTQHELYFHLEMLAVRARYGRF
jgi:hypothetical protein